MSSLTITDTYARNSCLSQSRLTSHSHLDESTFDIPTPSNTFGMSNPSNTFGMPTSNTFGMSNPSNTFGIPTSNTFGMSNPSNKRNISTSSNTFGIPIPHARPATFDIVHKNKHNISTSPLQYHRQFSNTYYMTDILTEGKSRRSKKMSSPHHATFFLLAFTNYDSTRDCYTLRLGYTTKHCWCCNKEYTIQWGDNGFDVISDVDNHRPLSMNLTVGHNIPYCQIRDGSTNLGIDGYSTHNCTLMCGACNSEQGTLDNYKYAIYKQVHPPILRPKKWTLILDDGKIFSVKPENELNITKELISYLV